MHSFDLCAPSPIESPTVVMSQNISVIHLSCLEKSKAKHASSYYDICKTLQRTLIGILKILNNNIDGFKLIYLRY